MCILDLDFEWFFGGILQVGVGNWFDSCPPVGASLFSLMWTASESSSVSVVAQMEIKLNSKDLHYMPTLLLLCHS